MTKHKVAQLAALLAAIGFTYPIAVELAAADLRPLVGVACTTAVFFAFLTVTDGLAARLAPAHRAARDSVGDQR
ncbi:hypothetical protein Salbus254_4774 [Streptomyces albidoflavus]|uniref:hypothetical protein n=1 Tax=Streptomyces albidoflavus TaxID=1886 RepID=UPI0007756910|nr:hypothetical protein [Streptomyces albidoflavus]AMM11228.1 hypothetical protein Salbus254_4774 [Streptomyces albidoflavus]